MLPVPELEFHRYEYKLQHYDSSKNSFAISSIEEMILNILILCFRC